MIQEQLNQKDSEMRENKKAPKRKKKGSDRIGDALKRRDARLLKAKENKTIT